MLEEDKFHQFHRQCGHSSDTLGGEVWTGQGDHAWSLEEQHIHTVLFSNAKPCFLIALWVKWGWVWNSFLWRGERHWCDGRHFSKMEEVSWQRWQTLRNQKQIKITTCERAGLSWYSLNRYISGKEILDQKFWVTHFKSQLLDQQFDLESIFWPT